MPRSTRTDPAERWPRPALPRTKLAPTAAQGSFRDTGPGERRRAVKPAAAHGTRRASRALVSAKRPRRIRPHENCARRLLDPEDAPTAELGVVVEGVLVPISALPVEGDPQGCRLAGGEQRRRAALDAEVVGVGSTSPSVSEEASSATSNARAKSGETASTCAGDRLRPRFPPPRVVGDRARGRPPVAEAGATGCGDYRVRAAGCGDYRGRRVPDVRGMKKKPAVVYAKVGNNRCQFVGILRERRDSNPRPPA